MAAGIAILLACDRPASEDAFHIVPAKPVLQSLFVLP